MLFAVPSLRSTVPDGGSAHARPGRAASRPCPRCSQGRARASPDQRIGGHGPDRKRQDAVHAVHRTARGCDPISEVPTRNQMGSGRTPSSLFIVLSEDVARSADRPARGADGQCRDASTLFTSSLKDVARTADWLARGSDERAAGRVRAARHVARGCRLIKLSAPARGNRQRQASVSAVRCALRGRRTVSGPVRARTRRAAEGRFLAVPRRKGASLGSRSARVRTRRAAAGHVWRFPRPARASRDQRTDPGEPHGQRQDAVHAVDRTTRECRVIGGSALRADPTGAAARPPCCSPRQARRRVISGPTGANPTGSGRMPSMLLTAPPASVAPSADRPCARTRRERRHALRAAHRGGQGRRAISGPPGRTPRAAAGCRPCC